MRQYRRLFSVVQAEIDEVYQKLMDGLPVSSDVAKKEDFHFLCDAASDARPPSRL